MMRSGKGAANPNAVVNDRQWIRRVKQEEINMIDSFTGPKLDQINQARATQQKNHFYPQHTRMQQPAAAQAAYGTRGNQEETKSFASRARDSDGLDSVSQVSVTTPKSQTGAGGSSRHGDSVSYVSHRTTTTTVSTKQKLEELEKQL